ncbi:MAG TPA: hypothetical protein VG755_22740 [Nannocystaceae bacterium]|nr:hypothetical protein [Nannocystaceae bacterium]
MIRRATAPLLCAALGCSGAAATHGGSSSSTTSTSTTAETTSESSTTIAETTGPAIDLGALTTVDSSTSESSTGDPPSGPPSIGPTQGSIPIDFRVSIVGDGELSVGAIDITDDFGTVEIDGEVRPVLVYERQPWPSAGYVLYQALAVADTSWTVLWFYCDDTGLAHVYVESTDGIPLQTVLATGTCEQQLVGLNVPVDLPGTEFQVIYQGDDVAIDGPDISVHAAELGSIVLAGVPFVVAPFETVDCSSCDSPGWYEVHVVLWDPAAQRAGFAIVYLESSGHARITYGITLPDLSDVVGDTTFDAEWSYG